MSEELLQSFTFDADAKTVLDFIIGIGKEYREIWTTDNLFAYYVMLCPARCTKATNCISYFDLDICDAKDVFFRRDGERWWWKENAHWLVARKECASIALMQNKVGECVGQLYAESDPGEWNYEKRDWYLPMQKAREFVVSVWRGLIQSWIESQPATSSDRPQITVNVNNPNFGTQVNAGHDANIGGDVIGGNKNTNQVIE